MRRSFPHLVFDLPTSDALKMSFQAKVLGPHSGFPCLQASTCRAHHLVDEAMFKAPASLKRLMARFLRLAMALAPFFLRTWLRSSSNVTSRIQ